MTRRLILIAALLSYITGSAAAQGLQDSRLQVTAAKANVRDTASLNGEVLFQVSQGDALTVLSKSGDWYFIETATGQKGYINASVARVTGRQAASSSGKPAVSATTPQPASAAPRQGNVLRNADIISMTKAGLGNDIVIGTIRRAESTDFDLSPAGLVALKGGGVSDEIIRLMLDGKTGGATPPVAEAASTDGHGETPSQPTQATQRQTAPQAQTPRRPDPPNSQSTPRSLGLGGRAGGFTFGLGGSVRYWGKQRLGFQIGVSHYGLGGSDGSVGFGIVTSSSLSVLQVAPALLYKLGDEPDPAKSVAIQPYAGGGLNIFHSAISASATGLGQHLAQSESSTNTGIQAFAGAEMFFKDLPRFGVGGDIGYYSTGVPFTGFQVGGLALSLTGHWYVR